MKKQRKPFSTPDGILKADWFQKQRQRRAAVAVAFVQRWGVSSGRQHAIVPLTVQGATADADVCGPQARRLSASCCRLVFSSAPSWGARSAEPWQ